MLARFSNEVLSRGPAAVLPQNLNDFWLKAIQEVCNDFLDSNFAVDQCNESPDTGNPLLVACIHEVLRRNRSASSDISADELAECVTIYALSITMETTRRESDIHMALPTLKNLLSIDRIVRFGKVNPEFGRFLEQTCIVDTSSRPTNWLQRLKEKIRTRIADS
jgi:hypothetical protein